MARGKGKSLKTDIVRIATLLGEGCDALDHEGIRRELESAGIDPAQVTARFHQGALRLVEDLRRAGQTAPLALQQAIAATEPSVGNLPPGSVET